MTIKVPEGGGRAPLIFGSKQPTIPGGGETQSKVIDLTTYRGRRQSGAIKEDSSGPTQKSFPRTETKTAQQTRNTTQGHDPTKETEKLKELQKKANKEGGNNDGHNA